MSIIDRPVRPSAARSAEAADRVGHDLEFGVRIAERGAEMSLEAQSATDEAVHPIGGQQPALAVHQDQPGPGVIAPGALGQDVQQPVGGHVAGDAGLAVVQVELQVDVIGIEGAPIFKKD